MQRSVYFKPEVEQKILAFAIKKDISFSGAVEEMVNHYFQKPSPRKGKTQ